MSLVIHHRIVYISIMPTNVTPEYRKAEEAYRKAKTLDEKIDRLEDMISLLPKHKGTDHLYADLKRRMSKLRKEADSSGRKRGGGFFLDITREGAAQVVLVGPPNSGKSSILGALTQAHPDIGDYPFTTHTFQPGMIRYEDIKIQLVDTPPLTADFTPVHLLGLVRSADAVLLVLDLSKDILLEEMDMIVETFSSRHVRFVRDKTDSRDDILCRILANKMDSPGAGERLALLKESAGGKLEINSISCQNREEINLIPAMIFRWLKIVRVYTKTPGEKSEMEHPYTAFEGQTVGDIARSVHKDFYEKLRFARLWRRKADPLTVSKNETIEDGDIVELHI